jgi:hypothetical protein
MSIPHQSAHRPFQTERLYHLVAVNDRTGYREAVTARPDTHAACATMQSRFNLHPDVRLVLEEQPSV